MSKMWERSLSSATSKVQVLEKHVGALQDNLNRMLFPPSDLQVRLDLSLEALSEARDRLKAIEGQNALQDQEEARRALRPLQPTRNRDGFHRDGKSRVEAILGILEFERRQNAPLKRGAFEALSQETPGASRSPNVSLRVRSFRPQMYQFEEQVDPATGEVLSWMDPCVEYRTLQKMRRQVMFAKGYGGKGYHTGKRWNPC